MTYRFEEEDFKNTYVLEDYYCTNPFCDCNHVTVSFSDREDESNRFCFLLHFNRTHTPVPNAPKLSPVHKEIVKGFVKNLSDELLVLFKQRYFEAKAYGEKNPMSYLVFEPGRYFNYFEMFPRNTQTLDFHYQNTAYFAEDSYELDPRSDNRSVKLAFFKLDLDNKNQPPIFTYTYYFSEKRREKEDAKLEPEQNDTILAINRSIPDLNQILKTRYKQAKDIGAELMKTSGGPQIIEGKIKPNDPCPCGSGKKFKKCCALKMN